MYQLINETHARHLPSGTVFPLPPVESFGHKYTRWLAEGNVPLPREVPLEKPPKEKDVVRYSQRASFKDTLLTAFAAENNERLRTGEWTVEDMVRLMMDPGVQLVLNFINIFGFEIAAGLIERIQNPLLTSEIKAHWIKQLQDNSFQDT